MPNSSYLAMMPSAAELAAMMPSAAELAAMMPSAAELAAMTPSAAELAAMTPSAAALSSAHFNTGILGPSAREHFAIEATESEAATATRQLKGGAVDEGVHLLSRGIAVEAASVTPCRSVVVTRSAIIETDAFLEQTLGEVNPAFLAQFRGATRRSEERGPDWWTQAAASERKLLLGVLHTAAPDHLVLPWVTNRKQQVDRCGHPTRRTKINWLCQQIANEGYRKFVKTELDSALVLIDVLDSANHVNEFPEFEESFSWMHLRVKVAIRHILEIWLKDTAVGR